MTFGMNQIVLAENRNRSSVSTTDSERLRQIVFVDRVERIFFGHFNSTHDLPVRVALSE